MLESEGILRADGTLNEEMFDEIIEETPPEQIKLVVELKECVKDIVVKECDDIAKLMECFNESRNI
ncbi:unnamed protein product [Acanthoscelides obtectus]|nr:unnamed protein product [Acanthoscelides obtectus]CAK1664450.1 hypothetical protein AOBTE_LOCUS24265 [Acanthoscelides obtectus]